MGIDVGSVRVGLAASDPDRLLATPVRTLPRDADGDADLVEIARHTHDIGATLVVVGLPRSLDGSEGPAAVAAREYAGRLAPLVAPVPIRLVDERLTTTDATRRLRESGLTTRRQRGVVDQAAAVLILQHALDLASRTGEPPGETMKARHRRPRKADPAS